MTPLLKTVFRETSGALTGAYGPDRGRKLIAGLAPGDLVEMRPKGTRRAVRVSIFDVYRYAVACRAQAIMRRAKELKKRDGGRLSTARLKAERELE